MIISSPEFSNNDPIPSKFTCDGDNINPPLAIEDVPKEAKSLALIVHDPDAPREGGWTHWIVWNISPESGEVKEGTLPVGAMEGLSSSGDAGYEGPCPPSGTHRYFFKLYALDTIFDLTSETTQEILEQNMEGHILEEAELVGTYGGK